MKSLQILCPWALFLSSILIAGSPTPKPQWVFDVKAPKTVAEKQITQAVKVKLQFEFGENSEDAVTADWAKEDGDSSPSWTSEPMVWRHPLKSFSIWINGEQQNIPYEALAGQGDISTCQAWASPHEVKVELEGGDAGLGYELILVFHESRRMPGQWILTQRIWRQGEFADDVFDRTVYHNDIWDNPNI